MCVLLEGGGVDCWGDNEYGQLGTNSTSGQLTPTGVTGLEAGGLERVPTGSSLTCGWAAARSWMLLFLFQILCCASLCRARTSAPGAVAVAAGYSHTCAVVTGGRVDCWGNNWYGQLGTGDSVDQLTPTTVAGLGAGQCGEARMVRHQQNYISIDD